MTMAEKMSDRLSRWAIDSADAYSTNHIGGLDHDKATKRLDELAGIPVDLGLHDKRRDVRRAIIESAERGGRSWLAVAHADYDTLRTTVVNRVIATLRDRRE